MRFVPKNNFLNITSEQNLFLFDKESYICTVVGR